MKTSKWPASVLTLLLCLGASSASALTTPSLEAVAAARSEGDRLLEAGGATALFDNETDAQSSGAIILRHRPSGFRCVFNPGRAENKVQVFPSLTRGDNVGCTSRTILHIAELYFVRAPDKTDQQVLDEESATILLSYPGAKRVEARPAQGPLSAFPSGRIPSHLAAQFDAPTDAIRIVTGHVGEWSVTDRFYAPPGRGAILPSLDDFWIATVLEPGLGGHKPAAARAAAASPASLGSTQQAGVNHNKATRLLETAGGGDFYEDVSGAKLVALRHRASHFICTFDGGPDDALQILPNKVRGDDTVCITRIADTTVKHFVTRGLGSPTLGDEVRALLNGVRAAHPDLTMATEPFGNASMADVKIPHASVRFYYSENGARAFSRLSVAMNNGWVFEQRLTAPAKAPTAMDLIGEVVMLSALKEVGAPR